MKRLSLVCSIIFPLAAAMLGAGAGTARAGLILLDVSGSMVTSSHGNTICGSRSGEVCELGGFIIINNSTNVVLAAKVTLTPPPPDDAPSTFDESSNPSEQDGLTVLGLPGGFTSLQLVFPTPIAGSLVGYTGGPLSTETELLVAFGVGPTLVSGSMTEGTGVPAVPEPSTLVLMVTGIAGVSTSWFARRRSAPGSGPCGRMRAKWKARWSASSSMRATPCRTKGV